MIQLFAFFIEIVNKKRNFILITFLFNFYNCTYASHIVGGDIYYDYLGNNNYRFYISVYRDCNSSGAAYDDPLMLAIYNSNNVLINNIAIPFPGSSLLPIVFNNPCVTPPNNICVEKAVYTTVINLPPTPGGYTVSYQRCCRGPNVTNLISPDNTGLTLTTHVPGSETNATVNSSPRFTNYPPLLLCNNDDLVFNHSATDPDGDQLVYSLVTPYSGGSSGAPLPNPAAPPNYFPVNWAGGFSAANPLGPGATININPSTGILTASPQMLGLFVVGIRVQEYRNGVLIGETVRDFLFKVFNCDISMQALLPEQEDLPTFVSYCQGLTVVFENNSFGGTNYSWNFGVSGITTDVSTLFEPTYTYPAPGTYQAMLVVNPGWPCTDTAYMDLTLNNQLSAGFSVQDSVCILNNSLDFIGITDGPPTTTFLWDFGPNASPSSATTQNVNNVSFNTSGFIPVSITTSNGTCDATYEDSIYIFPMPNAGIILPTNYECNGLTLPFGNNSTGTFNYQWDFGVSGTTADVSTLTTPSFTFPAGGTYIISLIGISSAACSDTTTETITVYEPLTIDFTYNDSLCITSNSFNFDGSMTGPSITTFLWDFGPNASIPSSTDLDVNNVEFNTFGTIPITLIGSFNSCSESVTHSIFIFREPTINFRVEPGPRCAPALVDFTDLSVADSPIYYSWNFGDGGTSTLSDPSHSYTTPGSYSVGLNIHTTEGCIDTLSISFEDTVKINTGPNSKFVVDQNYLQTCNSTVIFTNLSEGGSQVYYDFDDIYPNIISKDTIHTYINFGVHYPMQLVIDESGCRDSSFLELYVEPFDIFVPNSFTPDGNEFNNDFNAVFDGHMQYWKMTIYNKWGEQIFQSYNPTIGWDGTVNGKLAQDGTYSYIIEFSHCNLSQENNRLITGHLNLVK